MIQDFIQSHQKILAIGGIVLFLLLSGAWFASQLPDRTYETTQTSSGTTQTPLFSDLRLGTLVRDSFATQKNPPIKQKTEYTIKEKIMLRGTTTPAATGPVTLTVRLVNTKSTIVPISPTTITLDPGTNSYCCWTIPTVGEYTMQVFRPDSVITNIPLKIVQDFESAGPKQTPAPAI